MNRYILILGSLLAFINLSHGQSHATEQKSDSDTIRIYVNEKAKVILNGNIVSLTKLETVLQAQRGKYAKFATIFPTPMRVFRTVEQVDLLMKKYRITSTWYKDPEFTKLAFE